MKKTKTMKTMKTRKTRMLLLTAIMLITGVAYPFNFEKLKDMNNYNNISLEVAIEGEITVDQVSSIKIERSIDKLTDTARVILPREFNVVKKQGHEVSVAYKNILKYIAEGNYIKIKAGYDTDLKEEFSGYVLEVGAGLPLEIRCEDEMYKVKRQPKINKVYKSISLKELLKDICPKYKVEAVDMPLGKFTIENATPYNVFESLKKNYGIRCYFEKHTLHASLIIDLKKGKTYAFVFGKNIRGTSILVYKTKDKRKLYIRASSMQKGSSSKKVTYDYGDIGGDQITLHAPVNLTLEELKVFAEKTHKSRVFDGYDGDLESWGLPPTKVGDIAHITDPNYKDGHRDMKMLITQVHISLTAGSGYKRVNRLGFKV